MASAGLGSFVIEIIDDKKQKRNEISDENEDDKDLVSEKQVMNNIYTFDEER